ncbi:MAG: cytochrome oxidase assembly protein [Nitrososphaera sp.]|nr:cytochrome oxidase assembly protein [Nitrososphaera sp.]
MTSQKGEPRLKKSIIVLAFISLGLVYSTMIVGVYFSSIEQGIACTEWPLCPNGLFGAPEERYTVEYAHRLIAAIAAAFIYATAIIVPSKIKRAKKAALIAAAIVSVQLVLGLAVVFSQLNPLLVASHLSTGVSMFALVLLTFLWTSFWRKQS